MSAKIPFSIYIHTPWCEKKCPYCDFNSHQLDGEYQLLGSSGSRPRNLNARRLEGKRGKQGAGKQAVNGISAELEQTYLAALQRDLGDSLRRFPHLAGSSPLSIFIGGGTPSLLSAEFYRQLLAALAENFTLNPAIEITLEANPGSSERAKFAAYRAAGINRISIGAQSFSARCLKLLGRVHDPEDGISAYQAAADAGFERINLDLMYGLPTQTRQGALEDLQQALDLGAKHISHYQLTIEPNTQFAYQPPRDLPPDAEVMKIEEEAKQLLNQYGLAQYEVSAWARGERPRARHNLNYWQFGDYLGLGAGAHSKITLPADGNHYQVIREQRRRSPTNYMEHIVQVNHQRQLAAADLPYEFMLNALRLTEGFPLELFQQRTGMDIALLAPALNKAEELGLAERMEQEQEQIAMPAGQEQLDYITKPTTEQEVVEHLVPTERGRQMLNDLIMLFTPQE